MQGPCKQPALPHPEPQAAAEAAGIDLSSAGPVVVSDLTAALKEAWGVEVHVSCSNECAGRAVEGGWS